MNRLKQNSGNAVGEDCAVGTRRAHLCIMLLVLLGFALGSSEFVVIGIEEELSRAFQVSLARVGELISVYSLAYAVCTPLLSVAMGRFKRHVLLVAYASIYCLSNLFMVLAANFEMLLIARLLLGTVSGALLAIGVTFIPELAGERRASIVISVVYAAASIAMVVVTSAGKAVAHLVDWHLIMGASFVLAFVASVLAVVFLPRGGVGDEPARAREQIGLIREPAVLSAMLVFIFGVGSVYVFYAFITPYLEDFAGLEPLMVSGVLMAYGIASFLSNLLSGWLDARFGIRALVVSFLMQALLLVAVWVLGPADPWVVVPTLGVGLSMYLVSVPCISLFMRWARRRHPKALTLASSLEPTAFNIGIAFGSAVGGWVVAAGDMGLIGLVGAALSVVASLVAAVTFRLDRIRPVG